MRLHRLILNIPRTDRGASDLRVYYKERERKKNNYTVITVKYRELQYPDYTTRNSRRRNCNSYFEGKQKRKEVLEEEGCTVSVKKPPRSVWRA